MVIFIIEYRSQEVGTLNIDKDNFLGTRVRCRRKFILALKSFYSVENFTMT